MKPDQQAAGPTITIASEGSSASSLLPQSEAAPQLAPPLPPVSEQQPLSWWARFKRAAKKLKRQVLTLHYAIQDPRVGWLPRLLAFVALAYALSPFDLIPDFIPVLGLVDDLLLLPGMLLLAFWLIPEEVKAEARRRAENEPLRLAKNWGMAAFIFLMWNAVLLWLVWWLCGRFGNDAVQHYKAWIVAGSAAVLVAAEASWAVLQIRKERRQQAALAAAGADGDLAEALLNGGSQAVQDYLEP